MNAVSLKKPLGKIRLTGIVDVAGLYTSTTFTGLVPVIARKTIGKWNSLAAIRTLKSFWKSIPVSEKETFERADIKCY